MIELVNLIEKIKRVAEDDQGCVDLLPKSYLLKEQRDYKKYMNCNSNRGEPYPLFVNFIPSLIVINNEDYQIDDPVN